MRLLNILFNNDDDNKKSLFFQDDKKIDFSKEFIVFVKECTFVDESYVTESRCLHSIEIHDHKPTVVFNVYFMNDLELQEYVNKFGKNNIIYISENKQKDFSINIQI